ncbi:MAG: aspartate aminotransferase family protein [Verrucomicrobiae bacterium]|nr:aspartate aminotransferase family protein [Verrucomicrobiae bacterium]
MKTTEAIKLLRQYESRNVTFLEADGSWPIVWERAKGVHVWDADGKKYLDLTAAFGVAAAGHANPHVVKAGQQQMGKLLHAMGDVHPHALKAQLARELSRLTFERWSGGERTGKTIFCNSGFEAVEAALKTAMITGGKYGVIAFNGAYHGLGYGALNVTHRDHFKSPFRLQLREFANFVPFPTKPSDLAVVETLIGRLFQRGRVGAILVEPMQARGGINVPPPGFLPLLRKLCDRHGALLILDEIYTGFGRTGKWFACEHSNVVPDLICLGKALTGGFPLSACVGRADLMDAAWPASTGEAIHTSTFLGHPVGCAMALAQIAEIKKLKLPARSAQLGEYLLKLLAEKIPGRSYRVTVRGAGLMVGVELRRTDGQPATAEALRAIKAMLHRGYIMLPEGEHSHVISFTPPLTITQAQLAQTVQELKKVLAAE